MEKLTSILLGTAIALAMGLSLDMVRRHNETRPIAEAAQSDFSVFHNPRIGGLSLDMRMMEHVMPDPLATAARFCRDQGSPGVVDFMLRPGGATRTIADGTVHAAPGSGRRVFSMIRCQAPVEILLASR